MHVLLSAIIIIHLRSVVTPSYSQTNTTAFNFTVQPNNSLENGRSDNNAAENGNSGNSSSNGSSAATKDSLATYRSDNNAAENRNTENSSSNGSSAVIYISEGLGLAEFENVDSVVCEGCINSGSGTVNVHEEDFESIHYEECKDGDCNSGFGSNAESEVSSYSGYISTSIDCKTEECADSGSGSGECGSGDCRFLGHLEDEMTDASVYKNNGCRHSDGLVQWGCRYQNNGVVNSCYNMSRCDTAALSRLYQVCDRLEEDCVYVDGADFTALYYRCEYDKRLSGEKDVCHLVTALQHGDVYRLCEFRNGINTDPRCSDYPASGYCRYTQPSTNRLGEGCIYSGECGDVGCGEDEVTEGSVYEKNGCRHSGGLVQCVYLPDGDVHYCYNMSKCDTAAVPGRQVCNMWGYDCAYVEREDFTALYNRCEYDNKWSGIKDVCYLVTAIQQGDSYKTCQYKDGINSHPASCLDHSASKYCTDTQSSTNILTHTTIPVTVYITGLLLNHLILLVLAWKAEATVTNCLLKLLAVWDSLYLGCQLAEWAVWMKAWHVPSVIKDVGYAWVDTDCYLNYEQGELCLMSNRWKGADVNVSGELYLSTLQHMYYVAMYCLHTAGRLFQLMSVYQTVIIACFRYIAILFPFQADRYLTYTTAWLATLGCLVLAGLLHVPSIIGGVALQTATECYYKYEVTREYAYKEHRQCLTNIANNNPFYATSEKSFMTFFLAYHVIFYHTVMFFALPFVILLVLNTLMLRELWRGSQTQENIAVTRVVVAIVSVFLLSYIIKPFYIIDVFYFNGSLINSIAHSSCSSYFTMSVLIIIFPCLNSSVNFLIYVGFRESFRRQFVSMFDWCSRRCPCHFKQQVVVEEMEL